MSYSDEIESLNPVVHLPLDETSGTTAADSSGNGNDGTYSAGVVLGEPSLIHTEPAGAAVQIAGGTDNIKVPIQGDLEGATALTVGFTVKMPDPIEALDYLLDFKGPSYGALFFRTQNSGTGDARLYVYPDNTTATTIDYPAGTFVGAGTYDVLVVIDFPSGIARLYVNGRLRQEDAVPTDGVFAFDQAEPFSFGGRTANNSGFQGATFDRIFVTNTAVTPQHVQSLRNASIGETLAERITALSPVAYYKLDETSGTTAADSSGNGNDGTYSGGVTLDQPPLAWSRAESRSASFDGTDAAVELGASFGAALNGASAVSLTAVVQPTAIPAIGKVNYIASTVMDATQVGTGILVDEMARVTLVCRSVGGETAKLISSPENAVKAGATHHIAGVVDYATGDASIYVDGNSVASLSTTFTNPSYTHGAPSASSAIGDYAAGADHHWSGQIDEVSFHAAALTAADAFALAERVVQKTYRDTVSALVPAVDLGMNDSSGPPVDSQGLVTLTGDATEYALTGLADGAVRYAGTDYSAGSLDMSAWDGVTLHAQFKVNTHGSGSTDVILGAGSASYAFRIEGAGGSTYRVIMGSPNTIVEFTLAEGEDITVTGTHDDAGNIEAFVNGQSVGTATGAQSFSVSGKLTLHATPWNEAAADTQDVTIDEAQVFSRVLTPAQISALHYRGTTAAEVLQLAGTAMKAGVPVARLIRAHRQSDGSVIGETTSSAADGSWSIPLAAEEHCYVVAHGEDEEADLVIGDVYEPPPQPELVGVETAALENGNNLTIPLPAGVQDGDLLVLVDAVKNSYRSISAAPAGFTVDSETPAGSSQTGAMFVLSKVASGETGPYTLTLDSAEYQAGALLAIRNVTQPATEGALAESYDAPSVAAASAGLLLGVYMNEDNSGAAAAITPPEGMTLQATQDSSRVELYVLSEVLGEAGDTGVRTASGSGISKMSRLMFYPLAEL